MKQQLSQHHDFNPKLRSFYLEKDIIYTDIPPQISPRAECIERVWAQMKRYTQAHCNYSIQYICRNIPDAFNSITKENIAKRLNILCLDIWKA